MISTRKLSWTAFRDLCLIIIVTLFTLRTLHKLILQTHEVTPITNTQAVNAKESVTLRHREERLPNVVKPNVIANKEVVDSIVTTQPSNPPALAIQRTTKTPVHVLLSLNKPVTSDVRGNLGPPSVVANEEVTDWLKDRWQAAVDLSGRPIPGEHWLEIDLGQAYSITRILIDWEVAYSSDWVVKGRATDSNLWSELASSKQLRTLGTSKQHVIHEVDVLSGSKQPTNQNIAIQNKYRFVRLIIRSRATQWGSSVWRLQVWGYESL